MSIHRLTGAFFEVESEHRYKQQTNGKPTIRQSFVALNHDENDIRNQFQLDNNIDLVVANAKSETFPSTSSNAVDLGKNIADGIGI